MFPVQPPDAPLPMFPAGTPISSKSCDQCRQDKKACITHAPNKKCDRCIKYNKPCTHSGSDVAIKKEAVKCSSCELCRKLKKACTFATPGSASCDRCTARGQQCVFVFSQQGKRTNSKKPPTRPLMVPQDNRYPVACQSLVKRTE